MGSGHIRADRHRRNDRGAARPLLRQRGAGGDRHADHLDDQQRQVKQRGDPGADVAYADAFSERLTVALAGKAPQQPVAVRLDDLVEGEGKLHD